jgi:hypothetical protein
MIISDLVRLGRAYLKCGQDPADAIRQGTSIENPKARKFFRNVFVIEIHASGDSFKMASHGCQRWGDTVSTPTKRGALREEFVPDFRRSLATAAKMVTGGGNPRAVVGKWPVPAYLMYAKDIDSIRESEAYAEKFLADRLAATLEVSLPQAVVRQAAQTLSEEVRIVDFGSEGDQAGIVLLALADSKGPYGHATDGSINSDQVVLGSSKLYPNQCLVARISEIARLVADTKVSEAASKGSSSEGPCGVCGRRCALSSPYSKSWPWLSYTWNCPLPASISSEKGDPDLTRAIAGLCDDCFRSLQTGAAIVQRLERPMYSFLVKDIFSSYESAAVQDQRRQQRSSTIRITGMMFVLPILDAWMADRSRLDVYVSALKRMLQRQETFSQREHIEHILGFECALPDEISSDQYRLTIIYYSRKAGDIHARALVEDVLPSVAKAVSNLLLSLSVVFADLSEALFGKRQDQDYVFERSSMRFLPYLLARAYGSSYVFSSMQTVLTAQRLDSGRFVHGCASRMNDIMVSASKENSSLLAQEVRFYLFFREFLRRYNTRIAEGGGSGMPIESWVEFDERLRSTPPSVLRCADVEELGYAIGQAIRLFANAYWAYMKNERKKGDADFIRDRVMTFGTRLIPDTIWRRGLAMVEDYRVRLPRMSKYVASSLRERVGALLAEYSRMRNEVDSNKDLFMAAFWSGYALGSRRKEAIEADADSVDVMAELSIEDQKESE